MFNLNKRYIPCNKIVEVRVELTWKFYVRAKMDAQWITILDRFFFSV